MGGATTEPLFRENILFALLVCSAQLNFTIIDMRHSYCLVNTLCFVI